MDISEIKKRRMDAENEILKVLERLKKETGLCPFGVNVDIFDTTTIEGSSYYLGGVKIEFEPI